MRKAFKRTFAGAPTGAFSAQLGKLQADETTAKKLLNARLAMSDEKTTPEMAAKDIATGMIDLAKDQNAAVIKDIKSYGLADAAGQPPLSQRLDDLNALNLSMPANHSAAAQQALQLVQDYPSLSNEIAVIMQTNIWEFVVAANPNASPTELVGKYNESLDALNQELSHQPGPLTPDQTKAQAALMESMSSDRVTASASGEKSYADMLIELDKAAKAVSKEPVIERINAEAEKLMLAKDAIAADIPAMKAKAVENPAQAEHYEDRAKKMEAAVKDLDEKIADLVAKKVALQQEDPNPEKNEKLAQAMGAANSAVDTIERVAPAINHTRGDDPKYIEHYKEIDTTALKELCDNDAYKKDGKDEKTGDILRGLQADIEALNKATEALRTVAAKMVTPEAQAAYEKEYKDCLAKVDQCCEKIARATNDPSSRDLIDAAFANDAKNHDALSEMTKTMAELDKMNVKLNGGFTAGVHRDLIAPIDNSMEVSKDNAKKMGEYFTFKHEHLVKGVEGFLGKKNEYQTEIIRGKDGNPISLSREELKQLITKWNKEHPDQKPPIKWDEKKGKIECGTNKVKEKFLGQMVKCYDDRCDKEAKAVKEKDAPKKDSIAENDPAADKKGAPPIIPEVADGKPDPDKKADAGHKPVM